MLKKQQKNGLNECKKELDKKVKGLEKIPTLCTY